MLIEEIVKILGVEKLDESQQTDIKEKLDSIIDVKARERADSLLGEEKERLVNEYENKFEDYKKDITSKFSNFVDSVLDQELVIPEKVMEYARKGELYNDLVEQFKIRLGIDEGVLDEEAKSLLREAKSEITKLKDTVNELMAKKTELESDTKQMAANLYLRKKCDGLSEASRVKVLSILGDITDKKEIDRKYDIVMETILKEEVSAGTEVPEAEAETEEKICSACGAIIKEKGATTCSNCGASLEEVVDSIVPAEEQGQGSMEVDADAKPVAAIQEDDNPFNKVKARWVKILKENKF